MRQSLCLALWDAVLAPVFEAGLPGTGDWPPGRIVHGAGEERYVNT